ncbi:MAG: hypothetical protein GXY03_07500 [Solirubrobacterales bacterium]|mgnify:CR=1 FL=1|nr:hypothetical protein [Solirubrobacterales bacterium]
MNIAYKHLDAKLRIAELGIGQWLAVLAGVGLAIVWGTYVSPFGPMLTLTTSIYLAAVPAGAALLANVTEFDAWLMLRSALAWWRSDGRYVPGPGESATGYLVSGGAVDDGAEARWLAAELDAAALWGESR